MMPPPQLVPQGMMQPGMMQPGMMQPGVVPQAMVPGQQGVVPQAMVPGQQCMIQQGMVPQPKLLAFLGAIACKKRGWFPYENGHALVSHRAKALRGPEPTCKVKDYPYRVSMILRKGTWWIV